MSKHEHTFAICAYKESPYLEECILSLKNQTIESKIIIATSTRNDFIEKIAEKYSIPVFSHEDGGIGKDWNLALRNIKTKYGTIAHQDDIYKKDYAVKIMSAVSDKSIIAFSGYKEMKDGKEIDDVLNLKIKKILLSPLKMFKGSKFVRNRVLSLGNPICCPAVTYSMDKLGDFQFDTDMKCCLDWEACHRLSKINGEFNYVKEPLMIHRIHDESETTNTILDNSRSDEEYIMFKKYWNKFFADFLMKHYVKAQDTNKV